MDAEMQEAVSEHLLGYWDYILVTGAINRLTADREEGEDGEAAEEAVSGQ